MSEENVNVIVEKANALPTNNQESANAQNPLSLEEMKAQLEQLKSTNERLLNENKKHKARREAAEQEKLLAEGKKDEVIQQLQSKVNEFTQRERTIQVLDAVAKEASKRGCERWDHLFQLTGGDGIDLDETTGEVLGVKEFFDKVQSNDDYSYFFNSKKFVPTENRVPVGADTKLVNVDWRKDPTEYLYQVKKKSPEKYLSEVNRLQKEGIIR